MRDLDETDLEILQLLVANARRPYSDIAETVELSPPAVSDRVARLQEIGVIRRFTIDLDRSQLTEGIPVLITIDVPDGNQATSSIKETLLRAGPIEHVFTTAGTNLIVYARAPDSDIAGWLTDVLGDATIGDVDVTLLAEAEWSPTLDGTAFALTCAECGNTVDSEGTATRIDGDLHHFCCSSCESQFTQKYEQLQQEADSFP